MACLDQADPGDAPVSAAAAQCTTAIESYLEDQRAREQRTPHSVAQDELRGLARQLRSDRPDGALVVRRIRRVLGRLDARRRGSGSGT